MSIMTARATTVALSMFTAAITIAACSTTEALNELPHETPPTALGSGDAASVEPEAGLIRYCPSSECPMGYGTCPTSDFRCDVNFLIDTKNCGECGVACPPNTGTDVYACVDGRCKLMCAPGSGKSDCNGIVDDGCEVRQPNVDHCGVCGNKCSADKPCVDRTGAGDFGCGCTDGKVACAVDNPPLGVYWVCIDVSRDDQNCGACGNACDPQAGPPFQNGYYGCEDKKCGARKCNQHYGDCDLVPSNGCETATISDDHCGACERKCPDGMFCANQPFYGMPFIDFACAPGFTFCGYRGKGGPEDLSVGHCLDLMTDPENCGSCGYRCPSYGQSQRATGSCEFGACKMLCGKGWEDCNGNPQDDCETHVDADPSNCGGCGITCDAAAGQACVQGRCVVEPCEQDGGLAR